jgi:hypothetical protein
MTRFEMTGAIRHREVAIVSLAPGLVLALGSIAAASAVAEAAPPAPPLKLERPITLSDQEPDLGWAAKSRIVGLSSGVLVVAYNDAVEDDPSTYVYDLQADAERPARDIFVRVCDSAADDCIDPLAWSASVNISNTAALSSIDTDWTGDTDGSDGRTPFSGDAGKPTIFSSGSHVVVTWVSNYCPSGAQRTITYRERDDREVPFSCVYAAHASGASLTDGTWTVNRLTDGSRDANQDVSRGMPNGGWAIVWQEDPRGLQPGEAEGPGDGASGARVSFGTDIWYTYSPANQLGAWQPPNRLTDNQTSFGITMGLEELNPIKDANGNLIDLDPVAEAIENGRTGASRPNLALLSNTAIVAYEETKGGGGGGSGGGPGGEAAGKFVRYHAFSPFGAPPTRAPGCIVSQPEENGRRVRLVAQGTPGPESDLRWAIFWRQGIGGQGASADIVLRLGSEDFASTNLFPTVDAGCATSDSEAASMLDNDPPLNVSSDTPIATDDDLADATDANSVENARAHRALLRGDDLYVGYTYTEDDALAQLARPRANYDYWMRHLDAAAGIWTSPNNLSQIRNKNVDAKEPRLVGTPGNGPNCPADPEDCQDTRVFFAAWGTERKDPVTGAAVDLDIFVAYTANQGEDFAPAIRIARGDNVNDQAEDQLRSTPDGNRMFSVWNDRDRTGAVDARFTLGTTQRSLGPPD